MSREKGTPKTGGRQAGTLNKQTAELRQFVGEIIYDNMPKIKADIETIEPEKRLALFEKLLSYVLPKPQSSMFPIEDGLMRVSSGSQSWVIPDDNEADALPTVII